MPTRLTLAYPTAPYQVAVDIPDGALVFDGRDFVRPADADYVRITRVPSEVLTQAFGSAIAHSIYVSNYLDLRVLPPNGATQVLPLTTEVVSDPSAGMSVAILTSNGTKLAYVKVFNNPSVI